MAVKKIPCPFKEGDIVVAYAESRPTMKAVVLETFDGIEADAKSPMGPMRQPPQIRYRVLEVYCPCGIHPKEGEERIGCAWFWRKEERR